MRSATTSRSLQERPPRRVLVFRALYLGDMLCAVPALRAFRRAWPEASIELVGLPWAERLAERLRPYVDGFLAFPGWPGLPEQPPRPPGAFLEEVRGRGADLAVQLHGSGGITNPLVARFGARRIAGFHASDVPPPDPDTFLAWPREGREPERLLRLAARLGAPADDASLEFPITAADRAELAGYAAGRLVPGGYAVLHAGARDPEKRWAPRRFAAVGDALAARGLGVVLSGTTAEAPLTRAVAEAMRAPSLDLAGSMGLGALAALLADARLVVCNDTGVSHLTAAVRTPSVVVFLKADPARWAPLDAERHHVLHDGRSSPVGAGRVGRGCPEGVGVEEVLAECEALLSAFPAAEAA